MEDALRRRRGAGAALAAETRAHMEAGFGFDFGQVRVHDDAESAALSRSLGARAFTYGSDVYFRAGAYAPRTAAGAWLLAHELAHVVQQGGAAAPGLQRKCACGAGAGSAGSCASCEEEPEVGARAIRRAPEQDSASGAPAAVASGGVGAPAGAAGALIVEDDAVAVAPEQMRKSELIEATRVSACAAADEAMVRVGRSTEGCPYVERMLGHYRRRDAAYVERALRRFAPEAASARTARDYIPHVSARIARGVERWATTGEMPDVPEELRAQMAGGGIGGALASTFGALGRGLAALARALFKPRDRAGAARLGAEPSQPLGAGQPLDGAPRSRMERAFGHSFGGVRIHADRAAADLTGALEARAFTVGDRIVFGAGEYHPGDPAGDALLAHELAHVVQQGGSAGGPPPAAELARGGRRDLEHQADAAAAQATRALWAPPGEGAPVGPASRH
ncbi:MAG TPA: DUF4157 domain-containing protein, partial [Myxococcota bacterium]|nr:DUF4157 domain-containing protein [Myxococcota bacterium]